MGLDEIQKVESEIDAAFGNNALKAVPWARSAWTVLSVAEDHHFKFAVVDRAPERQAAIYVDGLLNALTYPLRVLHQQAPRAGSHLDRLYVDEHYGWALEWLDAADDYAHFCSIFPLFYAREIDLRIVGDTLEPSDWSVTDLSYEVYDRFTPKRDPVVERRLNPNLILPTLRRFIRSNGRTYSIAFSRKLLDVLKRNFGPAFESRHVLPGDWAFSCFSLAQYRSIFVSLQIIAEAWFVARQLAAAAGAPALAYESSVWTPQKSSLIKLLARHTKLSDEVVECVLRYLTFGEMGIRNPDIAIQPIVDLEDGHYAISPFVMTHVHAERNLCVLLNQIPADRRLYAGLVNAKEEQLRAETTAELQPLGFDFRYGQLQQTDVDLAVIDRKSKTCLCIELKWLIEPAEIREVLARSEDLAKGVSQAKLLNKLFAARDTRLLTVLGITDEYEFVAMVGSVNFVGRPGIQASEIPIVKVWHLVAKIRETGSLSATLEWLRNRQYLPKKDRDYRIEEIPIQCGQWKSRWYGIAYA